MLFETNKRLAKMTWKQRTFTLGKHVYDYLDPDTWYKGAFIKVYITIRTNHDLETNKYYMQIHGISQYKDLILDDVHIFDNRPAFKDIHEEVAFYDYLRAIIGITLSDIKLLVDNIYVVGPSGIINCKGNKDKNEAEKYFFANKREFWNGSRVQFLNILNDILNMDEVIDNAIKDTDDIVFNIPFFDDNRLVPSRFGFTPYINLIRKPKHGDLVFDISSLEGERKERSSMYVPDKHTKRIYALDTSRCVFVYKAMLDYYLKYGEEAMREKFTYNKLFKFIVKDEELESGWRMELTEEELNELDDDEKNNLSPDELKEHLKDMANIDIKTKAQVFNSQVYFRKIEDDKWVRDKELNDKLLHDQRPLWQSKYVNNSDKEHFGINSVHGNRHLRPDLRQKVTKELEEKARKEKETVQEFDLSKKLFDNSFKVNIPEHKESINLGNDIGFSELIPMTDKMLDLDDIISEEEIYANKMTVSQKYYVYNRNYEKKDITPLVLAMEKERIRLHIYQETLYESFRMFGDPSGKIERNYVEASRYLKYYLDINNRIGQGAISKYLSDVEKTGDKTVSQSCRNSFTMYDEFGISDEFG